MVTLLLSSAKKAELTAMEHAARDIVARLWDDEMACEVFGNAKALAGFLEGKPLLDAALLDITLPGGISLAERARALDSGLFLTLLAAPDISPVEYMRPSIMAASLLLRPFTNEELRNALLTALQSLAREDEEDTECFTLNSREGRRRIPYARIQYFEARQKKVFLCAGSEEYGFHGTIDRLEKELPGCFVRCHRSFIVHRQRISRVALSKNLVELDTGATLPLSRSYKSTMKEL